MLKKTPSQSHKIPSNLWLGFAFGAIAATAIAFLLGTKKGRQTLKRLLELSENLEENAISIAEEVERMIIERPKELPETKEDKPVLSNLLDKMKILRT